MLKINRLFYLFRVQKNGSANYTCKKTYYANFEPFHTIGDHITKAGAKTWPLVRQTVSFFIMMLMDAVILRGKVSYYQDNKLMQQGISNPRGS